MRSLARREQLAKKDAYFERLVPVAEMNQEQEGRGTKRKAEDFEVEIEKAVSARRDEVRSDQLKRIKARADMLTLELDAQNIATQQAQKLAFERQIAIDQQGKELEKLRSVVAKKETASKQSLDTNLKLAEKIQSVKDAERRRDESNRLAIEARRRG
ncbi:hypothetical protein J4E80_005311 [Alternaria sp. BMP 0032]|nr:hypothetical protein J4E80_005311 [Alternaria sp. BMP 0032]